jgi:hypothetical protein
MPNFPITDTQKSAYSVTEVDSNGNSVASLSGDVTTVVSGNSPTITIVPDATPASGSIASGFIVANNGPASNVAVTATRTHTDGTSITVTMFVDISTGPANTLVLTFAAPVTKP